MTTTPFGLEDITKKTAFMKRDLELLRQLPGLLRKFPSLKEAPMVGGAGAKFYFPARYTKMFPKISDFDLYLETLPPELEDRVEESNLLDSQKIVFSPVGEVKEICQESRYLCYKLSGEVGVDIFTGRIGMITPPQEVMNQAVTIPLSTGSETFSVRVAPPSLLLATQLNPLAYTEKRARRSAVLCYSVLGEEEVLPPACPVAYTLDGLVAEAASVFRKSGVGREALERVLNAARNDYSRKFPKFPEVIAGIADSLGQRHTKA